MAVLERNEMFLLKKGKRYISPARKWTSVESKAIVFDSLDDARVFLSSGRLKASIFVNKSYTIIRKRSNGSTVVEYDSRMEKIA